MRLIKRLLVGVIALALAAVGVVYGVSSFRMRQTIAFTDTTPAVSHDPETIARGRYLVRAIGKCADCHGEDLAGKRFIDGGPLGTFHAPNLTTGEGSVAALRTDAELVDAIRHGVGPGGRKLAFMPARDWSVMADDDVAAMVAYLRSLPPVDGAPPPSRVGPLGRALYAAGQLPLYEAELFAHDGITRSKPPQGVTVEYGRYLALIGGCHGCHGPTLSGGHIPGTPPDFKPAANITPEAIGSYTEADFFRALREGKRPDGTTLDRMMPVVATREMTDDDTRAILAYLRTVPARPYGGR
jgi:mono/diheme cytochrome c family protein